MLLLSKLTKTYFTGNIMEDTIKNVVKKIVIDDELSQSKPLTDSNAEQFESLIDMLECKREEKEYEWMSDIFIPEFASVILSDASEWANQYFTTRDFVEVKLDNENPNDEKKTKTASRLINAALNVKDVYHYQKYIRARHINAIIGQVYAVCWWDKEIREETTGYEDVEVPLGLDINGRPLVSDMQQEDMGTEKRPIIQKTIVKDHFNYDIIDPRNVFVDNKYCYSIRDKDYVILRSEKRIGDLIKDKERMGYFDLNKLEERSIDGETDTSKETYNTDSEVTYSTNLTRTIDIYERFGIFPCIIEEVDEFKNITKVRPALDEYGNVDYDNAEMVECIITFAYVGGIYKLIRFQPTPFVDSYGRPYKPIVRGWCYIHPTKDTGLSDGKYMRELQIGLNDTYNMSNDRTKLSTIPTMKGKRNSVDDNDTLYIAPGNVMSLESPDDLVEMNIKDDISGAISQIGMLRDYIHQVTARYPTVMGELPKQAATTATAVSATGERANTRENYKSLTIEYTFLTDLYWMILQMANQFMERETAELVLGDLVDEFDPNCDYTYSPVSSSIEQEYSKMRKLQLIDQFIARLSKIPNPNVIKTINYLLSEAFKLFGNEFPEYKKYLLDENAPPPTDDGQFTSQSGAPNSNQNGIPMSGMEIESRNASGNGVI